MLWTCTKIAAVEVPEHTVGPDKGRMEGRVACVNCLLAREKEEAGSGT